MSSLEFKSDQGQLNPGEFTDSKAGMRRAVAELLCLLVCIELIMWVVPLMQDFVTAYAVVAAAIVVLLAGCYVRDSLDPRQVGIRTDNFVPAIRMLLLPLTVSVALVVSIGLAAGSLKLGHRFLSMVLVVPVWALLQQYMLLVFAGSRLRVIFGSNRGVLATAALFALLHLPNPALMVACFAGGYIWAWVYQRHPNLLANSLTHGVGSAFLANSLPHSLLKNMVVGYNHFFR